MFSDKNDLRRASVRPAFALFAVLGLTAMVLASFTFCLPACALADVVSDNGGARMTSGVRGPNVRHALLSNADSEFTLSGTFDRALVRKGAGETGSVDTNVSLLPQSGTLASGFCGSCPWQIDDAGTLTIGAGNLGLPDVNRYGRPEWPWWKADIDVVKTAKRVVLTGKVVADESVSGMFSGLYLVSADLSNLDTSRVKDMSKMFAASYELSNINVSGWNTSSVTNMSGMFGYTNLRDLDLSDWDTGRVKDMSYMFCYMPYLISLNLSSWDTFSVEDMDSMFGRDEYGAPVNPALSRIQLGKFFKFVGGPVHAGIRNDAQWTSSANGGAFSTSQLPSGVEATYAVMPHEFSLDNEELTIKLPSGAWPLNNRELSLPSFDCPITYSVASDGNWKCGINYDIKNKPNMFKSASDFRENCNLLFNSPDDLLVKDLKTPKQEVSLVAAGYLEGNFNTDRISGVLSLKAKVDFRGERQCIILEVPVVLEASGSLEGVGAASANMRNENGVLVFDNMGLKLECKGTAGLYGGVGFAYIASAGIWGEMAVGLSWVVLPESEAGLEEAYWQGKFGLKALVFGESFSVTVADTNKMLLYPSNVGTNSLSSQGAGDLLNSIDVNRVQEPIGRLYAESTTPWNGKQSNTEPTLLQGDTYPDAHVQTVPVSGGTLMTFLSDDTSRNSSNRSVLMWSRFDNATSTWSSPQPVWQDGTADFAPSLCQDGNGGAFIAWSNARDAMGEGLTLSQKAKKLDVAVARYNGSTRSVTGGEFVTNDSDAYETSPSIGSCDGEPVLTWSKNSLSDLFGTEGGCDLIVARRSGGSWEQSVAARAIEGRIASYAAGGLGGTPAAAWSIDADGSQETLDDSSVWAWRLGGNCVQLSGGNAWNPLFVEASGADSLVWAQDGKLMRSSNGQSSSETNLDGLPAATYSLSGDIATGAILSYVRYSDNKGNVYCRVLSNGAWSDELALTAQGQSVTSWSACIDGGVPSVVYAASTETESTSTNSGIWSARGGATQSCRLDYAWYEDGAVHAFVTNTGVAPLTMVSPVIKEGSADISAASVGVHIQPNEQAEIQFAISKPTDGRAHTYTLSANPGAGASNPLQVKVGSPVITMSTVHSVKNGCESYVTTVNNAGLSPSRSGRVVFYDFDTGRSLHEVNVAAVGAGRSAQVSYSVNGLLKTSGVKAVGVKLVADDGTFLASGISGVRSSSADYSSDAEVPYDVVPISMCSISSISDQTYTGREIRPRPTVKYATTTLVEGTDYTLSYRNNINAGTATVTVTGKGGYAGTKDIVFRIVAPKPAPTPGFVRVTMHRLYNPNSGEHFYTANVGEKNHLVSVGWNYEGTGWVAPKSSGRPVYRLYNENAGDHHYTMNKGERDSLVSVGWKYEGIGWYSAESNGKPLYRQYNPNAVAGSHNYTSSKNENDSLVRLGWRAEGIGWYGLK